MFTHIDHIGFAVRELEEAVAFYSQTFEITEWERIEMPERAMSVAVARVGGSLLELIAPTSEEAAFAKFLSERGPGMHHVAYRADDIHAALADVKARACA